MAASPFYDRVLETSTTTGTGTLSLAGAVTGYQTFGAVGDGNTTPMAIWEVDANGNPSGAWEVADACTYTAAGTTLTRGTFLASSTGSAINFGAGTKRVAQVLPAAILNQMRMQHIAGTDADTAMAVNSLYVVDMSAWATADRTYTLPATAAVGDRVGVMVTAGDASHELIITANTGDTLNGIAGGTEWSRVFITNEVVIMRCVAANATWIVEQDGRIPMQGRIQLTTLCDGESAATWSYPTDLSGVWTSMVDVGGIVDTSTGKITARRACKASVKAQGQQKDAPADQKVFEVALLRNVAATLTIYGKLVSSGATTSMVSAYQYNCIFAADDYMRFAFKSEAGGLGLSVDATFNRTEFSFVEILP